MDSMFKVSYTFIQNTPVKLSTAYKLIYSNKKFKKSIKLKKEKLNKRKWSVNSCDSSKSNSGKFHNLGGMLINKHLPSHH